MEEASCARSRCLLWKGLVRSKNMTARRCRVQHNLRRESRTSKQRYLLREASSLDNVFDVEARFQLNRCPEVAHSARLFALLF